MDSSSRCPVTGNDAHTSTKPGSAERTASNSGLRASPRINRLIQRARCRSVKARQASRAPGIGSRSTSKSASTRSGVTSATSGGYGSWRVRPDVPISVTWSAAPSAPNGGSGSIADILRGGAQEQVALCRSGDRPKWHPRRPDRRQRAGPGSRGGAQKRGQGRVVRTVRHPAPGHRRHIRHQRGLRPFHRGLRRGCARPRTCDSRRSRPSRREVPVDQLSGGGGETPNAAAGGAHSRRWTAALSKGADTGVGHGAEKHSAGVEGIGIPIDTFG